MTMRASRWAAVTVLASLAVACGGSADPSPEPTAKEGEALKPVGGGGAPDPGLYNGKANACDPADPNDKSTWYCGPASKCAPSCFVKGQSNLGPQCSNVTDYQWVCLNASPGGCSHGCAPL